MLAIRNPYMSLSISVAFSTVRRFREPFTGLSAATLAIVTVTAS